MFEDVPDVEAVELIAAPVAPAPKPVLFPEAPIPAKPEYRLLLNSVLYCC